MTFAIGIRTIFRPENYCRRLLVRLAESGVLDHPSVLGVHVTHGEACNPNMNGVAALRAAARSRPDWVLFMEDDIDIIDDLVGSLERWLNEFARDDVLFYPLGSFYPYQTRLLRKRGAWTMPVELYYGSQAVAFRCSDALSYAAYLSMNQGATHSRWRFDQHFDMHLREWQLYHNCADVTITPAPCFIDHVGENSLMGTWDRTGRMQDFGGRDWSFSGGESERRTERSTV